MATATGDGTQTTGTGSDSTPEDGSKPKKNRPKDTKLRQQKLPAWQPILTAATVIPAVFAVGILFIPIGIALLLASSGVKEIVIPYEKCNVAVCTIRFNITEDFTGDVYFYYGLDNYFQNHRRYVKSRNDRQLRGVDMLSTADCTPFNVLNVSGIQTPIAPCGAIANSMFNDTFALSMYAPYKVDTVPLTYEGILWAVDKDLKFRNPPTNDSSYNSLCNAYNGTVKPPNWSKRPCDLDTANAANSGFQNVDFIVWMRTAALPTFRKPYRRLNRDDPTTTVFTNGLPTGSYTLTITNNYNVSMFEGRKSFIISTTSWVGGRNPFFGIAYITVGGICILLGLVFLVIHIKFGHSLNEMSRQVDAR